jgi:signal transduction histidine kinase
MKSSVALQENTDKESIEISSWLEAWKDAMEDTYDKAKIATTTESKITHWNTYSNALNNVLSHLVENSVQHNQDRYEQDELAIKLTLEQSQNQLCITYSDNGKGIEDKDREHIFQPFFTTKRQAASSKGLGMYQTYNLITETLSGQIQWPDSQDGFKITLLFDL